jgi:hypothetical protein
MRDPARIEAHWECSECDFPDSVGAQGAAKATKIAFFPNLTMLRRRRSPPSSPIPLQDLPTATADFEPFKIKTKLVYLFIC